MKFLDWLAAVVLWFQLPVPLFWLVLHPLVGYWRPRRRAAYATALLASWGGVTAFLTALHGRLFASQGVPALRATAGVALILLDLYLFRLAQRELGRERLVGKTELAGGGELATEGIYSRMRHPRYTGTMMSVLGACLVAGTPWLWLAAGAWWIVALVSIGLEERELRSRFGEAYEAYSRRVPRFLPLRFGPRQTALR